MWTLSRHKIELPKPEQALPGRAEAIVRPGLHTVLGTPLSIVQANAETMEEELKDSPSSLEHLKIIERSTERMSNLVKDLMLLSRLESTGHDGRGQAVGQIRPTVLFIDEAHRLNRQSQELLYSCIEERVIEHA